MRLKHFVKQNTPIPTAPAAPAQELVVSNVAVSRLLDQCLTALQREVKNLTTLSANGKLDKDDARDLRETTKLLFELKDRENELLKGMSDEELKALANADESDGSEGGVSEPEG